MVDYNADIGGDKLEILRKESLKTQFTTDLTFLGEHNGWRRGNVHVLLGASSGGKSTLLRTCLIDALSSNNGSLKVGVVLSEESKLDFLTELNFCGAITPLLKRLLVFSEQDNPGEIKTQRDWFKHTKTMVEAGEIDILFFDNLTTSITYEAMTVKEQSNMAIALKRFASAMGIPVVIFAHTSAEISETYGRIINMNNIRGCKTIVNLSQFFYIMQSFYTNDARYNTLKITKHRGQEVKDNLFQLIYEPKARVFKESIRLKFDSLKEIFKERNVL